jgi:acyl homoserine lactone synthase
MIKLIQGKDRRTHPQLIDQMHRLRKATFFDRMHWEVPVISQWEIDGYDAVDPLYVLSLDDYGNVAGGLRLLPTMGINMLNDTFPQLLPNGERFASPRIWESSRFTIDRRFETKRFNARLGVGTAELGLAMNQIGKEIGLTHVVTVYDALVHRILDRGGCAGEPLCEPQMIGKVLTYSVVFEIGDELEARLREASGIDYDVLNQEVHYIEEMRMAA